MTTERAAGATPVAMLLHRAWLETRGRFAAASAVVALIGASTVFRAGPTIAGLERFTGARLPYARYVWLSLSNGWLQFLWITAAVLLGVGGLLREQSAGTASFTLALPVSRTTLLGTRAAVAAAEAVALALIPFLLVALLSPAAGYHYPLAQALRFAALLAAGGLVFQSLGYLAAHLLRGDYAAPAVALSLAAALYLATRWPPLKPLDAFAVMSGKPWLDPHTALLRASLPAGPALAWLLAALALTGLTTLVALRRDF